MVYDCFSFYNELDLLEIRLNVLKNVVDKFVLAEATQTHTGKPKPLYYEENKSRFSEFADRIIHIVVDDFPSPPEGYTAKQISWMRENWQRNAVSRGLTEARPNDIILISDLDEIPSPSAIRRIPFRGGVVGFEQMFFNFFLNFWSYTIPYLNIAKAVHYDTFCNDDTYAKFEPCDYVDPVINKGPTASKLRRLRPMISLSKGGWHFSYLGNEEKIVEKINAIAIEYANDNTSSTSWIKDHILNGDDITGCGHKFFITPLDKRFPDYILRNRDRYANLILTPSREYFRKTYFARMKYWCMGWIRRTVARVIPKVFKPLLFKLYCKLVREPIKI